MIIKNTIKQKSNFSLIEFIVIFTLLFCIFALLVAVSENAVKQGQSILCSSNQSKLGVSFNMYCHKSKGLLPIYSEGWIKLFAEFSKIKVDQTKRPTGIFACPSQKFTSINSLTPSEYWRGSNYGINQHSTTLNESNDENSLALWSRLDIKKLKDPSTKVILADAVGGNFFDKKDLDPTIAGISLYGENFGDSLPSRAKSPFPYLRHTGLKANFLYIDGHVEAHSYWPKFSLGRGTYGFRFWSSERSYPSCGY